MGKFIKVSRDDLFNKVRQSLSGYEVSGDSQNRLMTSVYHLVSYMEKEHLSDYTPDVGVSYLSTINVDKGIAYRHYQRDKRAIVMLDSIISGDADSFCWVMCQYRLRKFMPVQTQKPSEKLLRRLMQISD